MKWEQLITNKRLGQEYNHDVRKDDRSEFKRDYDFRVAFLCIIGSLIVLKWHRWECRWATMWLVNLC